jgi:hypothetical protein
MDGEVRGRARVRLHVGVLGAEQRLGAVDDEALELVDDLLALVVALAGVALGVLVGEDGAGGLEDGRRHVVLRRDHADLVVLALGLGLHQVRDLGVGGGEVGNCGLVHGASRSGLDSSTATQSHGAQISFKARPFHGGCFHLAAPVAVYVTESYRAAGTSRATHST